MNKDTQRDNLSNWNIWMAQVNNKLASLFVDIQAKDYKEKLPILLVITIFTKTQRNDNKLPTPEEFETLYKIEGSLAEKLQENGSRYVGRITSQGYQQYFIYTNTRENTEEKMKRELTHFSNYKYEIQKINDSKWEHYYSLLYPPKTEQQKMANIQVIIQLESQGDTLHIVRTLDHVIMFSSIENREKFMKELGAEKKIIIHDFVFVDNKEVELPYSVELHIPSSVIVEKVHEITGALIHLAEKNDGLYDGWGCEVEK